MGPEGCTQYYFVGREGATPYGEIEITDEDGGSALMAFGYQVVEGLVLKQTQGLEAEIVDEEDRQTFQTL